MRISDWSSDVCSSDLDRISLFGCPAFPCDLLVQNPLTIGLALLGGVDGDILQDDLDARGSSLVSDTAPHHPGPDGAQSGDPGFSVHRRPARAGSNFAHLYKHRADQILRHGSHQRVPQTAVFATSDRKSVVEGKICDN